MSDVKIKPCPFCAKEPKSETIGTSVYVKCSDDGCIAGQDSTFHIDTWNDRPLEEKLKSAIQKMLNGIDFALDESFSRRTVSSRLKECRSEAIKLLVAKTK